MQSYTTRDRLVYPVAAILALGLVSMPHQPGASAPRLAEISAVRLQAEVSSLVTGVAGAQPPAAAAASLGTGAPAAAPCNYPCTVFDKIIDGLPPKIRDIVLPPLYVVALVIGALLAPVLLVTSAVFGWPYSLRPAAAISSRTSPAPASAAATAVASDPIPTQSDPGTASAIPGDTADAGDVAVGLPTGGDDNSPRIKARGTARVEANPIESPAEPETTTAAVTAVDVAAVAAAPVDEATPTVNAGRDIAPATGRPARNRSRSPEAASTDSAQTTSRAAKRSVR